ncbi:MAG: hypothetical protein ACTSPB_01965 [Candidatus Thorarchaeota archaeon]
MKDEEAYKRTLDRIKKILSYKRDLQREFGSRQRVIEKVFGLIKEQLDKKIKGEEIKVTGEEKSKVKEVANMFLQKAIHDPIPPIVRDLTKEFGLLIFNWNNSIGKRPDITQNILLATRIVDAHMALVDAIFVAKTLCSQMRKLMQWTPPAFDLSRAYLKSLEEPSEKGGST